MNVESDNTDVSAIVDAMARVLGLELDAESRTAVILHLQIAFRMAPAFMSFRLPDDYEPATVYTP